MTAWSPGRRPGCAHTGRSASGWRPAAGSEGSAPPPGGPRGLRDRADAAPPRDRHAPLPPLRGPTQNRPSEMLSLVLIAPEPQQMTTRSTCNQTRSPHRSSSCAAPGWKSSASKASDYAAAAAKQCSSAGGASTVICGQGATQRPDSTGHHSKACIAALEVWRTGPGALDAGRVCSQVQLVHRVSALHHQHHSCLIAANAPGAP